MTLKDSLIYKESNDLIECKETSYFDCKIKI